MVGSLVRGFNYGLSWGGGDTPKCGPSLSGSSLINPWLIKLEGGVVVLKPPQSLFCSLINKKNGIVGKKLLEMTEFVSFFVN